MEREEGTRKDANGLARLATYFREQLERAEILLIEGASSEPDDDENLLATGLEFVENARDTSFKCSYKIKDGRRVVLTCKMEVEESPYGNLC